MAKNAKQDLSEERKALNMTREQRREAQRKELMRQGLEKRKKYMKDK